MLPFFFFLNPLGEANSARNFLTLSNLNIVCWRKVTEEEETKQIQTDKEIKRNEEREREREREKEIFRKM